MIRIAVPDDASANPHAYAASHHARSIMAAAGNFAMTVYRDSMLSLREFEGARLRMAEINGCLICQQFRAARDAAEMLAGTGARPERFVGNNGDAPDEAFVAALAEWRTSPLFTTRERLAVEFAERFAEEPKVLAVDEDFWARMHANFSDAEIMDLSHCVAAWMGLGRIAHVLGFDSVCTTTPVEAAAAA